MLHNCVAHVPPHVHIRVLHVYTSVYVCYKSQHRRLFWLNTSVAREDKCLFQDVCVHVNRVHICVFTCAHMCVPTGHVFVFQEHMFVIRRTRVCVCVCVCLRVLACTHMCFHVYTYVCSHVHVCVFHVYTFVCSRVHTCAFQRHVYVFQENTCLLSDEDTCVLRMRMYVCSRVRICVVYTCAHMCVPTGHVFVFRKHVFIIRRTRVCVCVLCVCVCACSGCAYMCVC